MLEKTWKRLPRQSADTVATSRKHQIFPHFAHLHHKGRSWKVSSKEMMRILGSRNDPALANPETVMTVRCLGPFRTGLCLTILREYTDSTRRIPRLRQCECERGSENMGVFYFLLLFAVTRTLTLLKFPIYSLLIA